MSLRVTSVLLTMVAGMAALVAMELTVRWLAPQPLQHIQLDDELYFVNRPDLTFTYARADEYAIPVAYNAWGFRGPIPPEHRPPGTTRILLLGDSQTEGLQVALDQTYGAVLRREVERRLPGRRVEVVNLAVSAYGTHQELLTLTRHGPRLRPDLVVLGFYPDNDVADNVRLPLVADDDGRTRLVAHRFSPRHRLLLGTKIWIASRSHLYVLTTQGLKRLLSWRWLAAIGAVEPPANAPVTAAGDGLARATRITTDLIRMLHREAERLGAPLVVLTIPSKLQVLDEPASSSLEADRVEAAFVAGFERDGIAHVETLAALRRAQRGGIAPFFRVDGHLNALGHRVVGEALAEFLLPRLR